MTIKPPPAAFADISLPGTRLHYVKCGSGAPLLIVPATVSLIEQWLPLAQFMGQRFTTYFFELPGHGKSTPYPQKFESHLLPPTAAAFMDAMGHERFNLMGFSFGGLLALRTLEALQARVDRFVLLSPCVSHQALKYSRPRRWMFKGASTALKIPTLQGGISRIMNSGRFDRPLIYALSKASNIEESILKSKDALKIPQSTLDVLAYTVAEIFSLDYFPQGYKLDALEKNEPNSKPFSHQTFFGMSIYDDLLDYDLTLERVKLLFDDLTVQQFTLPYHQPPEPPTFEWLVGEFGHFLDLVL